MSNETKETEEEEKQKRLNLSFATRKAEITIEDALYEQHDMYLPKLRKISRIAMAIAGVLAAAAIWLIIDGSWIFGSMILVLACFALFMSHATLSAGGPSAYDAGLLVPAVITSVSPTQIVALANIANSDDDEEDDLQWACKRVELNSLPLHDIKIGERVPCVALFGGSRNGTYVAFEPRPLTWATSSTEEIRDNKNRIESEEWAFLSKVYSDVPVHKANQMVLFDKNGIFQKII